MQTGLDLRMRMTRLDVCVIELNELKGHLIWQKLDVLTVGQFISEQEGTMPKKVEVHFTAKQL